MPRPCSLIRISLRTWFPQLSQTNQCALESTLARETMASMRGKNLGPMEDHAAGVPIGGGGGLRDGAAIDHGLDLDDESRRLIDDDDVRLAIRRIAGVDLLHEGAVELLPRATGTGGETMEGKPTQWMD
jgi:hypothetical protein